MLPDTIDPGKSLLESESHRLNLIRWMHQCELMKRYYQADKVFVLQKTDLGFEVIVSAADASNRFPPGKVFAADESVFQRMVDAPPEGVNLDLTRSTTEDSPKEFSNVLGILSRPVLWPDGSVFGCLCVINAHANEQQHISPYMLEPFQILLQQDLALLCQSHRIESLSMRDRETGMLNHYGFIMMAPRQLNLGRRFGAHSGIIFLELIPGKDIDDEALSRQHKELGNLILSTIRTADIAAHYSDSQYVLLVFVDLERDLEHIIKRLERQMSQLNPLAQLDSSSCFFSPDSAAKLAPMLESAKAGLKSSQQRVQKQE
ncbi:GGDEF domain-containing protein [Shewanella algae]